MNASYESCQGSWRSMSTQEGIVKDIILKKSNRGKVGVYQKKQNNNYRGNRGGMRTVNGMNSLACLDRWW